MRHHYNTTINPLPQTDCKRISFVSRIERMIAPLQLLRRETYQTAMGSYSRQSPTEAKTIGQKDIGTFSAKLLPIEILSIHDATNRRLGRGNKNITSLPTTSRDVPSSLFNVFLQFLILIGIIFLHPIIFYTTLEIEDIVRILF